MQIQLYQMICGKFLLPSLLCLSLQLFQNPTEYLQKSTGVWP